MGRRAAARSGRAPASSCAPRRGHGRERSGIVTRLRVSAFVLPARNRAASEPLGFAVLKSLTFEDVCPFLVTMGDYLHRSGACDRAGTPVDQRVPERRA